MKKPVKPEGFEYQQWSLTSEAGDLVVDEVGSPPLFRTRKVARMWKREDERVSKVRVVVTPIDGSKG